MSTCDCSSCEDRRKVGLEDRATVALNKLLAKHCVALRDDVFKAKSDVKKTAAIVKHVRAAVEEALATPGLMTAFRKALREKGTIE